VGYLYVLLRSCLQKLKGFKVLLGGVLVLVWGWFVWKVGVGLVDVGAILGAVCGGKVWV
jgi:hypothetical protein